MRYRKLNFGAYIHTHTLRVWDHLSLRDFRIARNHRNPEAAIKSALNDITVNDVGDIQSLISAKNETIENDTQIPKETTKDAPPPKTRDLDIPEEPNKPCLIFDEENFRVVNLCPEKTNQDSKDGPSKSTQKTDNTDDSSGE